MILLTASTLFTPSVAELRYCFGSYKQAAPYAALREPEAPKSDVALFI